MQRTTQWFGKMGTAIVCAMMLVGAVATQAADKKNDPTGTWSWTMQGRPRGGGDNANANTNAARKITLKLKAEGDKLTGSVTTPAFGRRGGQGGGQGGQGGQGGGQPVETQISDGKVSGDDISFTVTREFGGNSFSQKYTGKVEGDSIKGKITFKNRDGEEQSRDWQANREK